MIYTYVTPSGGTGVRQTPDPTVTAAFYATLGETITVWQTVEAGLFHVFALSMGFNTPRRPLSAAFHQVPSFRAKLDMTNAALKVALTDSKLGAEWGAIYGNAVKLGNRRNAIAHGVLFFEPGARNSERSLYLHPSPFDEKRACTPRKQANVTTSKELREMRSAFAGLSEAIQTFQFDLMRHLMLSEASSCSPR